MAREYKLNKSELSRLKRQEKLFSQYLPVLKLKQEQIQLEDNRIKKAIAEALAQKEREYMRLKPYIALFADKFERKLSDILVLDHMESYDRVVAGVTIKTLKALSFKPVELPYFQSAPWLIRVIPMLKPYVHAEALLCFLYEEREIMKRELRKATQKVNLFDMVLIPKTKEAIKRIRIALGDEQVASVSRGKIAKLKKEPV